MGKTNPLVTLVLFIILLAIAYYLVCRSVIRRRKMSEYFGMQTFNHSFDCKKYSNSFGSCDSFLETIDNGGIEQTPAVKKCADLCYRDFYAANLPY